PWDPDDPLSASAGPDEAPGGGSGIEGMPACFFQHRRVLGVVNILMLAGPLYMLQIYDRVLASRSVPTLVALTIFLVGALAFQGILDVIRSRIVVRAAALLDRHLAPRVHAAVVQLAAARSAQSEAPQPVRDLEPTPSTERTEPGVGCDSAAMLMS